MQNGYHQLPAGKIAAVVTYLEMTAWPASTPRPWPDMFDLRRVERADLAWYRALFRRIGEDWLWFSRLSMSDATLAAILHDPSTEVYILSHDGNDIGLLELDFRKPPECELAFLGLTADAIGTGAGGALMDAAIDRVWTRSPAITRFLVHTCTLDHPGALAFYQRAGFKPYVRSIEIADDPRLDGRLPRTAAAWLPIV